MTIFREPGRRQKRLDRSVSLVALLVSVGAVSCRIDDSGEKATALSVCAIPIEGNVGGDFLTTEELAPGETVRRRSYTLGPNGKFTLTSTIEREVGFFGVDVGVLDADKAKECGLEPFSAVVVCAVKKDSPAERAGLLRGDVLTRIGDRVPRSPEQFAFLVETLPPGDKVEVGFVHAAESRATTDVIIGAEQRVVKSKAFARDFKTLDDIDRTGMKLIEVPREMRPIVFSEEFEASGPALLVAEILPGSPAFRSAIRLRDRIVTVGDKKVGRLDEFRDVADAYGVGAVLPVTADQRGQSVATEIRLADNAAGASRFNLFGLVNYHQWPSRTWFHLAWGMVMQTSSERSIEPRGEEFDHVVRSKWGVGLNLIRYEGQPKGGELVLAWVIPISFGR